MNQDKTILVLYELSGTFTKLYRELGYNVAQVDKQLDSSDVRLMKKIKGRVVGIIAHPPCTDMAGSGARWWKEKGLSALHDALSMIDVVMRMVVIYQPDFWFIEHPVGRTVDYLGKPQLYFHPHEYCGYIPNWQDEAYTKKTCLWGKFNIPKKWSMNPVLGSMMHKLKNPNTGKYYSFTSLEGKNWRSKTPLGFATAFVQYNGVMADV